FVKTYCPPLLDTRFDLTECGDGCRRESQQIVANNRAFRKALIRQVLPRFRGKGPTIFLHFRDCQRASAGGFFGRESYPGPCSHQLPWIRPLRQEPLTCFSIARLSISSNVLSVTSVISDVHVPEKAFPARARADHVPCHPSEDFRADHVPSRRIWFVSLRRVHDPLAALCVLGRRLAHQRLRNECVGP